ncbi:hypothetical protein LCGC14_2107780, partial [marine sediment metagenome]
SNAEMQIIFGPHLDINNVNFFRFVLEYKDRIKMRWINERKMPHFQTADGVFASLESDHEPLMPRNGVAGLNPFLVRKLNRIFFSEWEKGKDFDAERIFSMITDGDLEKSEFRGFAFIEKNREERVEIVTNPADDSRLERMVASS